MFFWFFLDKLHVCVYKRSVILGTCHHYYDKMHLAPECVCTEQYALHCIYRMYSTGGTRLLYFHTASIFQNKSNRTDNNLHVKYCKMKKLLQRDSTVCICTVFKFCCLNSV